ncbi:hypothetical protein HYX16_03485 [Candidatus Woesearchaeota archaeon]|nr:hypothetical protein [Candidatus Woesearchaeota archaeon]
MTEKQEYGIEQNPDVEPRIIKHISPISEMVRLYSKDEVVKIVRAYRELIYLKSLILNPYEALKLELEKDGFVQKLKDETSRLEEIVPGEIREILGIKGLVRTINSLAGTVESLKETQVKKI